jgi:hypothetical protein
VSYESADIMRKDVGNYERVYWSIECSWIHY